MKCLRNLLLLLTVCSCVDPDSLDRMQEYADTKLESNIKEYAGLELNKWWREYYRNEAYMIIANAKAYENTAALISRFDQLESVSSEALLDKLIKLYEINLSLKSLSLQTMILAKKDDSSCMTTMSLSNLNLRSQIEKNYLAGLKFPTMTETYMIGGGTGEDGISKTIEAVTTSLGSLFNHDKIKTLKKKIKKIKKTYQEKIPNEGILKDLSYKECIKVLRGEKEYDGLTSPIVKQISEHSKREWEYYLQTKTQVGNVLLKRKFLENSAIDEKLKTKLGISTEIKLKSNLTAMRNHGLLLAETYLKTKTQIAREEVQDFIKSFDAQLEAVHAWKKTGLSSTLIQNRKFLNELKGALNE